LDSTKQFKLLVTKAEEIKGLPASAKALAAQQAAAAAAAAQKAREEAATHTEQSLQALTDLFSLPNCKAEDIEAAMKVSREAKAALTQATTNAAELIGAVDATAESGPWLLTLDYPSYLPSMQHLPSCVRSCIALLSQEHPQASMTTRLLLREF